MSKLFLASVIAVGCQSRFRNGMQFTDKPSRIAINGSDLAVLKSDRYLQVTVVDVNDAGADDDTGKDIEDSPISPERPAPSEDTPSDDAIVVSGQDSVIIDKLENEPTPNPDADTDTAALPEAPASEAQSAPVPEAPVDHVETITAAMRGLNLDMTADKPTVYDLQALGLDISAKERDAAWNVLTAEYAASNA